MASSIARVRGVSTPGIGTPLQRSTGSSSPRNYPYPTPIVCHCRPGRNRANPALLSCVLRPLKATANELRVEEAILLLLWLL
jgi:hypothetical protein